VNRGFRLAGQSGDRDFEGLLKRMRKQSVHCSTISQCGQSQALRITFKNKESQLAATLSEGMVQIGRVLSRQGGFYLNVYFDKEQFDESFFKAYSMMLLDFHKMHEYGKGEAAHWLFPVGKAKSVGYLKKMEASLQHASLNYSIVCKGNQSHHSLAPMKSNERVPRRETVRYACKNSSYAYENLIKDTSPEQLLLYDLHDLTILSKFLNSRRTSDLLSAMCFASSKKNLCKLHLISCLVNGPLATIEQSETERNIQELFRDMFRGMELLVHYADDRRYISNDQWTEAKEQELSKAKTAASELLKLGQAECTKRGITPLPVVDTGTFILTRSARESIQTIERNENGKPCCDAYYTIDTYTNSKYVTVTIPADFAHTCSLKTNNSLPRKRKLETAADMAEIRQQFEKRQRVSINQSQATTSTSSS